MEQKGGEKRGDLASWKDTLEGLRSLHSVQDLAG